MFANHVKVNKYDFVVLCNHDIWPIAKIAKNMVRLVQKVQDTSDLLTKRQRKGLCLLDCFAINMTTMGWEMGPSVFATNVVQIGSNSKGTRNHECEIYNCVVRSTVCINGWEIARFKLLWNRRLRLNLE